MSELTSGMLWYDADPKTPLEEKLKFASAAYQAKYGRKPDAAEVHKGVLEGVQIIHGLTVRPGRGCLPHHMLIGVAAPPETKGTS